MSIAPNCTVGAPEAENNNNKELNGYSTLHIAPSCLHIFFQTTKLYDCLHLALNVILAFSILQILCCRFLKFMVSILWHRRGQIFCFSCWWEIVFYNQINDLLGYNLYIYVYHFHLSLIGKSYELFVLIIKFIKNNVIIIESCYAFILGRLYFLMRARLPRIRYIS